MSFNMIDFIEKKRDGGRHTKAEFDALIRGVMDGSVPDYQTAAWLMAVYFRGLDGGELTHYTDALAKSGETYSYPPEMRVVDTHSTGGVGDKTTLVLLPLAAACGAHVSKLSGPGLGFTGGTVDKDEKNRLRHIGPLAAARARRREILRAARRDCDRLDGAAHSGEHRQQKARRRSLRLAASIVSKKLVGGASGFVFDVKCGSGAFMETEDKARELARELVALSKKFGRESVAAITSMEQPLGEWVGNAAEVYEAIEVLSGRGPADTRELCAALCGLMLEVAGIAKNREEGAELAKKALDDGRALAKFGEVIAAQGGDAEVLRRPLEILPRAKKIFEIKSDADGVLSELRARPVGEALRALGGGRMKLDDKIDHAAAIRLKAKTGDAVRKGGTVMELHYNDEAKLAEALKYLDGCWKVSETAEKPKLIADYIY